MLKTYEDEIKNVSGNIDVISQDGTSLNKTWDGNPYTYIPCKEAEYNFIAKYGEHKYEIKVKIGPYEIINDNNKAYALDIKNKKPLEIKSATILLDKEIDANECIREDEGVSYLGLGAFQVNENYLVSGYYWITLNCDVKIEGFIEYLLPN